MVFFQFSSYSRTARTTRVHAYWPGQTVFEILYFTKTGPEKPDNAIKRVYVTCVSFLPKSLDILDFVQIMRKFLKRKIKVTVLLLSLVVLYITVTIALYITDERKIERIREGCHMSEHSGHIDHPARLRLRKKRMSKFCESIKSQSRVEHDSFYKKPLTNEPRGTFFTDDKDKHHFICHGFKTGSTSWEPFFEANNISFIHLAECQWNSTCPSPSMTGLRMVQVRHPFERLLSGYRHIFLNKGWRNLGNWQFETQMEEFKEMFSKTWPEFVENIIINNGLFIPDEDLDDPGHPCSLIKNHWAPIWFTCDLCSPGQAPELIIKTETLGDDVKEVLRRLGMVTDVIFHSVWVTGMDDQGNLISQPSEQLGDSGAYTVKYFSQLTRRQILDLYQIYRMDFLIFGYHADSFLELLSQDFNENLKNGNL